VQGTARIGRWEATSTGRSRAQVREEATSTGRRRASLESDPIRRDRRRKSGVGIENPVHLLFLGAVALIVLGPKRLPELARAAGKGMREFRESLNGEVVDEGQGEDPARQIPSADAPDRGPL
jgi:sec-independent protein translocase protein TatA